MKKIFLACAGIILILFTVHILTPFYGGLPGIWHRAQGRIVTSYAERSRDPGACALIRGYWGRSIYEKLRDRCVRDYVQNIVQRKSDCHISGLIRDVETLPNMGLGEEYRSICLLQHYQAMLGNALTREWLPSQCLDMRDRLVIMDHYLADIRVSRMNDRVINNPSPLNEADISTIEYCENLLDTPKIYAFLRDTSSTLKAEKEYIESQKQKMLELGSK